MTTIPIHPAAGGAAHDEPLGILARRRIEAEIIKPIYEIMKREFGLERAQAVIAEAVRGARRGARVCREGAGRHEHRVVRRAAGAMGEGRCARRRRASRGRRALRLRRAPLRVRADVSRDGARRDRASVELRARQRVHRGLRCAHRAHAHAHADAGRHALRLSLPAGAAAARRRGGRNACGAGRARRRHARGAGAGERAGRTAGTRAGGSGGAFAGIAAAIADGISNGTRNGTRDGIPGERRCAGHSSSVFPHVRSARRRSVVRRRAHTPGGGRCGAMTACASTARACGRRSSQWRKSARRRKAGVCRLALTGDDRRARNRFIDWARDAGRAVRVDAIGNIFAVARAAIRMRRPC